MYLSSYAVRLRDWILFKEIGMSKIVEELMAEHEVLAKVLTDVKEKGVSTDEGRGMLMSAREGLLAHLAKEDEHLYPQLMEKSKEDQNLKNLLDTFARDMDGISKAALDFFDKYQDGGSEIEFAKDFGALYGALSNRIRKEETILYPEFDKIAD